MIRSDRGFAFRSSLLLIFLRKKLLGGIVQIIYHLGNAVACQPPAGYTLKTGVDKYYKPVKNTVTWQAARAACSSEGTILAELRTAADYQAMRPIFGKIMFRYTG